MPRRAWSWLRWVVVWITPLLLIATSQPAPAITPARKGVPSRAVVWPQFHGDPASRGVNRFEDRVGVGNVSSLSLKWIGDGSTVGEDLVFNSSPVVAHGLVTFGTDQGQVLAFPAGGCGGSLCRPTWRADLPQSIYSTPAIFENTLFVGTASRLGRLYAFTATGCGQPRCQPIWSSPLNVVESSPKIAGGILYVGSSAGNLYAFDPRGCGQSTCQPLWVGNIPVEVDSSPAIAGGLVYVGARDGSVYVFEAAGCGASTCEPLWRAQTGGLIFASSPAVAGGLLFQPSFDGRLNVFTAAGCGQAVCQPLWKGDLEAYGDSSPTVAGGFVYIGHHEGWLVAFRTTGCGHMLCEPDWYGIPAGSVAENSSSPMVANGVVYIGSMVDRVYAFKAAGCGHVVCDPIWEFVTQDPIVNSTPVMDGGTLYVGGSNFGSVPELYVFRPFF